MKKHALLYPHSLKPSEALSRLASTTRGLSAGEAAARLRDYGLNELERGKAVTLLDILVSQFTGFMILLLTAAAVISGLLGEWLDAIAIVSILILNGVMGTFQEYRAEKAIEALRKMVAPTARVVRSGIEAKIPASELVPGDIILLEAGDRVPADARLFETVMLEANEAPLTGESLPVQKDALALAELKAPVPDRFNTVFMGTTITSGRGSAVVYATGMTTEFGKIAAAVQEIVAEETPLKQNIEKIGKQLAIAVVIACAIVFGVGTLRGIPIVEMFLASVSLAVAAVPEGLPAMITIALALGVQRMSKRNAVVRKLVAVETLGSTNVILVDKTGTLTKNEMTVKRILAGGKWVVVSGSGYEKTGEFQYGSKNILAGKIPVLRELARAAALCNNAALVLEPGKKFFTATGDPTEAALLVLAEKTGVNREALKKGARFVQEVPFDSVRKRMTVVYSLQGKKHAFMKGAPEVVLEKCSRILTPSGERALTRKDKQEILAANATMAGSALRVLGFAQRTITGSRELKPLELEKEFTFIGLAGMIDAPREEVPHAVSLCEKAGIFIAMITGDNPTTATAVAREIGLLEKGDLVVTGSELDSLSDSQLDAKLDKIRIYARIAPEHKLRLVNAWKRKGKIVAVTGDGVNDAPALKRSDIGIAMGVTGTDVAKQVSDVVLADDNFASIVTAVEEGRGIYDNIRKCIAYLLSGNIGEVLIVFLAILLGFPLPLVAIQLLWINLVTDGLPALALAMDPVNERVMVRPPRPRQQSVWKGMGSFLFGAPLLLTYVALSLLYIYSPFGLEKAQTMVFLSIIFFEKYLSFACRSLEEPVWRDVLANKWLVIAFFLTLALDVAIVHVPFLNQVFHTTPLSLGDWMIAGGITLIGFFYLEASKWLSTRRNQAANNF